MYRADLTGVYLSRERIAEANIRLADAIRQSYPTEPLLLIGVLKGSFVFLSDLVRELEGSIEVDFLSITSYTDTTSGSLKFHFEPLTSIEDKIVIVVEDIVETGRTTSCVRSYLKDKGAKSIKVCTLLNKPSGRLVTLEPDYVGFDVAEGDFVVGYGLDHDERYRNLPDIHVLRK